MAVAGGKVKKGNLNLQAKDMITDVNMLDVRIGSNEQTADKISQHFSFLDAKIEAMKQYRCNMDEMNCQAGHRPKADVVKRSQTAIYENRKIRELVMENTDLKNALVEHQDALEYIMGKYRSQMSALMDLSKEKLEIPAQTDEKKLQGYVEKMAELIAFSEESVRRDEHYDLENEKELARLRYENKYLKECLGIGLAYGSVKND